MFNCHEVFKDCATILVPRESVSKLGQNQSVLNIEGKLIHPEDVKNFDNPQQNFMIFQCFEPNIYLKQVLNNSLINRFLKKCEVIVHFTKSRYLKDPLYQDFLAQTPSAKHLLIKETNPSLSNRSSCRFQFQLNHLDSKYQYIFRSNPAAFDSSDPSHGLSLERVPKQLTLNDALRYNDGSERDGLEESVKNLRAKQSSLPANQYKSAIIKDLRVKKIDLIPVKHCAFAYGLAITSNNNFRYVYSGDTEPCDSLLKFARTNFHSTQSEAIEVSRLMRAKFTILTHFSQRYGKLPYIAEMNRSNIGIAFDNMRLDPTDLPRIPLLNEPLKVMYAKHLERIRLRAETYQRKYSHEN
ncbi:Zinc phosphodiesterase ELAC protein 2 [Sarcoptes scabiei]|uniref:ribonuclease Z n=1 Tax=Sarcoptes scabiei TaxID=52283 RepID=A0A834R9K0_SARSC|nr:Zinc phosphodiesterase ELAC protein 2 [Sarcoptes scabiei]